MLRVILCGNCQPAGNCQAIGMAGVQTLTLNVGALAVSM
jgi:hypothetical protein